MITFESLHMVTFHTSDIFTCSARAYVNPVNCVGVSGRGLAKGFASKAKQETKAYEAHCSHGLMKPGDVLRVPSARFGIIYYFATKGHWRNPSHINWVRVGLDNLVRMVNDDKPDSLAIPAVGCGNGGLAWGDVRPLIVSAAKKMCCPVMIFEPQ